MSNSDAKEDKPTAFGSTPTMFGSGSAASGGGGLFSTSNAPGLFGNSTPFNFSSNEASAAFGASAVSPAKNKNQGSDDEDGEGSDNDADESHAAEFKPLVQLAMVEVKSCEEDEDVMFKHRSKLFVFVKEDNYGGEVRKNYWKERGLGDIKILKDRNTGESRLLMRQDKTLKIAANHRIDPQCEMKRTTEKTFTFSAVDFANDEGEPKKEVFSVKFGEAEAADKFLAAFEEAKKGNAASSGGKPPAVKQPEPAAAVEQPKPAAAVEQPKPAAAVEQPKPAAAAVEQPKPAAAVEQQSAAPPTQALVASAPTKAVVGAFSKKEDVFNEQVRLAGKFANDKIGKGTLVRIASCKSQVVAGKNLRMALHILYKDTDQVHAHVVTVFQPLPHEKDQSLVLSDEVHTGRVF